MRHTPAFLLLAALLACLTAPMWVVAQPAAQPATATVLRPAEMRSDKLARAPVLRNLQAGAQLRVLSVEGGWILAEEAGAPAGQRGWLRAGAVEFAATGAPAVAAVSSGREAGRNGALTLGVRSLPARYNRHALIIGISRYADPLIPTLPGAHIDRESATQMAHAMQVPQANIRYLQDEAATAGAIRAAIGELEAQVQEGDRVFIHFSGHGTRYNDPAAGGCVEALLAYDGGSAGILTNREMSRLLKPLADRTDKLFVMYDACHSGGIIAPDAQLRTRGFRNAGDEGLLRPKFAAISDECSRPVNVKTRNLILEAATEGLQAQDLVHVSSSRDNEISFDDEQKGGLATQFVRDCMLREAKDLDGSGAITMDEIRQCAQEKINRRMQNDTNFKPHNIVLSGNSSFVPTWFSQPPEMVGTTSSVLVPPVPQRLTGLQALRQIFEQRDAKYGVTLAVERDRMRIGQDSMNLAVQSERAGYVYVAMAGSDNNGLHLLFPNSLDKDNQIEAGRPLVLPRNNWRVKASGPEGTSTLLVLVTDAPRDLAALALRSDGPFLYSLNDAQGRARLGALMTSSAKSAAPECAAGRKTGSCSDAYGAAIVSIREVR